MNVSENCETFQLVESLTLHQLLFEYILNRAVGFVKKKHRIESYFPISSIFLRELWPLSGLRSFLQFLTRFEKSNTLG